MRPGRAAWLLLAACCGLSAAIHAGPTTPPELLVYGGRIFTADPVRPWTEAMAIQGGRIVAIGTSDRVRPFAGPGTRQIDLKGHVVIPGIDDAHVHADPAAEGRRLDLPGGDGGPPDPSLDEVLAALGAAVKAEPEGRRILAVIGPRAADDPRANRATLDAAAPRHPVFLDSWAGHLRILNSAALAALGITDEAKDPRGGWYARESGRLTGAVHGYGVLLALRKQDAEIPPAQLVDKLRSIETEAARKGITSVQVMAIGAGEQATLDALRALGPKLRWRIIGVPLEPAGSLELSSAVPPAVTVSGTKWFLDGTPVERDAWMAADYADKPAWHGRAQFDTGGLEAVLERAQTSASQPLFHAIGDAAIEQLLSAMERSGSAGAWKTLRVRIEHADFLTPEQIKRVRALGIVVVQNPMHFALRDLLVARLGTARAASAQPLRSLVKAGIPLGFGSDGPLDPYRDIMLAASHPARPSEALTREEAVTACTRGSAFAEGAEKSKGSLAPGLLADFAVLSQDIFEGPLEKLPGTHSVLTVVGGSVVYDEGLSK